ncbi:long-chain acyl-CoA synthetase [Mycobacterium sp. MAA66]|uniref:AMP-binding protein n=1 Tax=Mycobacterium sp. MAA66 TaxID=3156297 RepID=UPI0035186CD7
MSGNRSVPSREMRGVISGDRHFSFDEFDVRARKGATVLADHGVRSGDSVGLMLRNDVAFLEASFAAAYLGASLTPINWHFTGRESEFIIRDSGIAALVIHESLLAGVAEFLPPSLPLLTVADPPEIVADYGIKSATAPGIWDDAMVRAEMWTGDMPASPATTVYTSGTTGRPKGVRRSPLPAAASADVMVSSAALGLAPGMRTLIPGPLYHAAPNAFGINAIKMDGLVVLQSKFDAEQLLRAVEQFGLTHLQLVPTMFTRLLRLPDEVRRRYDLSTLEKVVHTAAPCPPAVKEAMIDWWGPVIHELYAGTELGPVAASTSEEWLSRRGSVGRPLQNSVVKIVDEAGHTLAAGEIGEIYVRNIFTNFTYHRRTGARGKIEHDGFVTCGDVGYLDDDGYLYICDRRVDMVISGGVNIYPAEVEAALFTNRAVVDCAVFGIPDEEYGEAVVATIQLRGDAPKDADLVRAHLRRELAGYKVPKFIEFVDELPREDSGKVLKRQLRTDWIDAHRRTGTELDDAIQR